MTRGRPAPGPAPVTAVLFGSRHWTDVQAIERVIDELIALGDGSFRLVTGANGITDPRAPGIEPPPTCSADAIADFVARARGFLPTRFPARWDVHDFQGTTSVPCRHRPSDRCPAAGPRRNQEIIDRYIGPAIFRGDQVHAVGFSFKAAVGPGTDDMRARLRPYAEAGRITARMVLATGPAPDERRQMARSGWAPSGHIDPFPI